ncbi:hypothetical protein LX16_3013 [Stackebrandtia albiflava]|uniref:Lipoprotein n=1 Tax=Stackebrandtia albiflava TaxID=406432 RepID=A0A562V374_9ACTN|nr:hypothetical protein [Stackebrandtia albiflava]TWJ12257.1 hypothetical protein LX16_3013 [Stackebrandtia albiflava]
MRSRAAILGTVLAATLAGCGTGGGNDLAGHTRLIDELAQQVDGSGDRGYTAEYLLGADGAAVTIGWQADPPRAVYRFPGGRYVVTEEYTMVCTPEDAPEECRLTDPTSPGTPPGAAVLAELSGQQYLAPQTVIGWLTEAGASSAAAITSDTRSIAGAHTTCVLVSGAEGARVSDFEACFTDAGLLGSFSGTVDGEARSVVLASVSGTVDAELFEVPADAVVTDDREVDPT